jgi:hypothetical protein
VEPEETAVSRQMLDKHISAATKPGTKKVGKSMGSGSVCVRARARARVVESPPEDKRDQW